MRHEVAEWCSKRAVWLTDVTSGWFDNVKQLELYIDTLVSPGFMIDEIGMLILSRMYRLRLAVLFHKNFWTSLTTDNLQDCNMFLAYTGRHRFSLTIKTEPGAPVKSKPRKRKFGDTAASSIGAPQPQVCPMVKSESRSTSEQASKPKYVRKEVSVSLEDIRHIIARSERLKVKRTHAARRKAAFQAKLHAIRKKNERWRRSCMVKRHYIKKQYVKPVAKYPDPPSTQAKDDTGVKVNVIGTVHLVPRAKAPAKPKPPRPMPPRGADPHASALYRKKLRSSKSKANSKSKTTVGPYKCFVKSCGTSCDTKRKLYAHIAQKHPKYRYKCEFCSNEYQTKFGLDKHIRKHAGRRYPCQHCHMEFHQKHELKEHMRLHVGSELVCKICGRTTTTNRAMKRHALTHGKGKKKRCKFCKFTCTTAISLQQHERQHKGGMACKCGHKVTWYQQKQRHENTCVKCKRIYAKEAKRAKAILKQIHEKQ